MANRQQYWVPWTGQLGQQSLVVVCNYVSTAGTFLAIDAIRDAAYQPPAYEYGVNVIAMTMRTPHSFLSSNTRKIDPRDFSP